MHTVNYIPALLLVLTLAKYCYQELTAAERQTFDGYVQACLQEEGLELDYVNNAWKTDPLPNERPLNCYYDCLNVKMGVIDTNGNISVAALKKICDQAYNATIETDVMSNCDVPEAADHCDTAHALMTCVQKETT